MNFIITILTIELAALLQGIHAAGFTKEERSEIEIAFSTTAGCRTYPIYRGGGELSTRPRIKRPTLLSQVFSGILWCRSHVLA